MPQPSLPERLDAFGRRRPGLTIAATFAMAVLAMIALLAQGDGSAAAILYEGF